MKKRDRIKKKQRKRQVMNQKSLPKEIKEEYMSFRCCNCGEKMDIFNDYQWSYGFCTVACGMETYE